MDERIKDNFKMENINCTKEMEQIAINSLENFMPLPWQKNAVLTGVGFDERGQKVIEFVEYTDDSGASQSSYHGDMKAYANRVINFTPSLT